MFTKILITVAVVVAAALYLRARESAEAEDKGGAKSLPQPGGTAAKPAQNHRLTALILLTLLGIGSLFFYVRWSEAQRLVTLRVVNSSTGTVIEYQAFANELQGRTFVTADGRRITLADVERMELLDADR